MATLRLPRGLMESARMITVLAALSLVFALTTDRFFGVRTFQTVAGQVPALLLVSTGMTFIILTGAIDLSVGSVLALAAGLLGTMMLEVGWPWPLAALACVVAAAATGAVNALVMIRWRLPAFIVTLGMLEVARGGAYLVTRSQTRYIGGRIETLAEAAVLGVPLSFLVALGVVIAAQLALSRTVFGRHVVAVGTNEEAVRLAGIDTRRVKLGVFVLGGLLTGVAAVLQTARLAAADPNAGIGLELQAIAAVVIGGTSLRGGRGTVTGTFFGVLIMAVLDTGLAQLGVQEPMKRLITGCVIIGAVVVDQHRHAVGERIWAA